MGYVTGYTKAKLDEMEGSALASVAVDGNDDLIVTRVDASQFVAGNVRGSDGAQGAQGEVSQSALDAALAPFVPGQWYNLTLTSNWESVHDTYNYYAPPVYRLHNGNVYLEGVVQYIGATITGSSAVESQITTALPVQFRPAYNQVLGGMREQTQADIRIYPDGIIRVYYEPLTPTVPLDTDIVNLTGLWYPLS